MAWQAPDEAQFLRTAPYSMLVLKKMIKPVKVQAFPHCIFKERKELYTVFSLEDKAEQYQEFRAKRQESEAKLKQGEFNEAREQHEKMVSEFFNGIVGDYVSKIGFDKPRTRVSYGPEQQIYVQDNVGYVILDDKDEKKKISLNAELDFKAEEELKCKMRLHRANQQGDFDYFRLLKELFNSYQQKQRIAEPLIITEFITEIHPPDYFQKALDLMCYFFNQTDKKKLDYMLKLDYELRINPFRNDFTKEILKKEYAKEFENLEKSLFKAMKNVDIFKYLKKEPKT